MGIILISFGQDVRVIAQGGFCAISKYFGIALGCLVSLASLLGGKLHLVYLDEPAWGDYQKCGTSYLKGIMHGVTV